MPRIAPPPASRHLALFLDLDGTLVPIADRPEDVHADAELLALLAALQQALDGALAIVSGRSIAGIDAVLAPLRLPAAGLHGLELRGRDGSVERLASASVPAGSRERLAELVARHPGLLLEDKGPCLALHYRGAPELAGVAEAAVGEELQRLGPDYFLQRGKMVLELRPAGASKGTAVERLASRPPWAGRRPVYIGDDATDEHGFEAVNRLGGDSIRVAAAGEPTAARWRLADEAAVRRWLAALVAPDSQHCA